MMSKQELLEAAIDYLLRNWEDASFSETGHGVAHEHSSKRQREKSSSLKRERSGDHRAGDFDKRLQMLVEAALNGHLNRGDQYRLQQAQDASGDDYTEVLEPNLDNLVFGAPYKYFVPTYVRGGWAGATDISGSFAVLLKNRHAKQGDLHEPEATSLPQKRFKGIHVRMIASDSHDQAKRVKHGDLDGLDVRITHLHTPTDATLPTLTSSIVHETAQLSSVTRERPNDVSAWLAYAAHQPRALAASGGKVKHTFVAQKQANILEEALKHNPGSEALLAGLASQVAAELAESSSTAGRIGLLQNLAQDFRGSRVVWTELLGTIAMALDPAQESLDPTEEAGATIGQLQAICVEAAGSLAMHANRLLQAHQQGGLQTASMQTVWRAECAAVEAIARTVQLEMSRGDTLRAVQLVQAACEWFSCPRVSWTTAHRQRWFRAFWESEAPRVGMAGATGFTGWVDSQTLDWRQQQNGPLAATTQTSLHVVPEPQQVRQRIEGLSESGEGTSESDTSSDEEELDEVEALLRDEQLRQQYRQLIAEAKDQQYTSTFLRRFVEAEARHSSRVTGLGMDDDQSDREKESSLQMSWERIEFLREFWPTGDACSLAVKATMGALGISGRSLSGPYAPELLSNASQFAAHGSEVDLSRPMLLGDALGLLFEPFSSTHCGKVCQHPMPWLQIMSFESLRSQPSQGKPRALKWYAQSYERHRLATAVLQVLLSSQSRLEGDIGMVRALFEVECTQICTEDGDREDEGVAGKRAHGAAKRWLAGHATNPQTWSAFAAMEARRGRYPQALNALHAAMNDAVSRGLTQHRWVLVLSAICVIFSEAKVPLCNDCVAMARSDRGTVESAAHKCMHLLLWAADPRGQLKSLGQDTRNVVTATFSSQVQKARATLQEEAARASRQMLALDGCPGTISDDTEVAAASVCCALIFEVLGSICRFLPAYGWMRAKKLFSSVMVRNRQVNIPMPDHTKYLNNPVWNGWINIPATNSPQSSLLTYRTDFCHLELTNVDMPVLHMRLRTTAFAIDDRVDTVLNALQSVVPEGLKGIRHECHGWACLLATLAFLERSGAAPQKQQDMQVQLLQQFPGSAYLSYQTATMCAVTAMPTRLRISTTLLLRVAGPTAPLNMQLIPVIDACTVEGNLKAGRLFLSRLASHRPLQRKRKAATLSCEPLGALSIAADSSLLARASTLMESRKPYGLRLIARSRWLRPCSNYSVTICHTSRLAVVQLAYMQLLEATSTSSSDALHVGISARHHFRWCKGLWFLSAVATADAMDEKDIRYFSEQLKWSGIMLGTNFDELRLMLNLDTTAAAKSVTDVKS